MKTATSSNYLIVLLCLMSSLGGVARGDVFGSGINTFEIEFVTIGDPGNVADTTGNPNPAGTVPYTYRIGKYEISEQMVESANTLGGLGIPIPDRGPNVAATINWLNAAKFVNWLNTSKGYDPAYKFDSEGEFQVWEPEDPGYDPDNLYRNTLAQYVLPDVHEWYKSAYYDPVTEEYFLYPTGSNEPPISVENGMLPNTAVTYPAATKPTDITDAGGLSPYGTMAQGGNVDEWHETDTDLLNGGLPVRIFRGGSWHSGPVLLQSSRRRGSEITLGSSITGFRVVHIPEPTSFCLFGLGVLGSLEIGRRTGRRRIDCENDRFN